ncbi:hypothetical protein [Halomonas sp. KO116]|uniref:hypothetical protein n=1 Tax=Halomonas sp. KO116 TaxID=1504981 RepID=UPI0004E45DF8|nr:hypothetical protein [Halomonas sp. KO116]AJY53188.1 hypothetical protein KO116_P200081 [Halomonas sp. KO116]
MIEIDRYFKHRLAKLGYDDDMDVRYSLSYSQGDGMAFYGKIDTHAPLIERFKAHLESGQATVYKRLKTRRSIESLNRYIEILVEWSTAVVVISPTGNGRYHGPNSMNVETEALLGEELIDLAEDDNYDVGDRPAVISSITQGEPLWDSYLEWLREDGSAISHALEREGYNILDAMVSEPRVVWEKTTPQYSVVVELQGDEDALDSWDSEIAIDTLCEFAAEKGACYWLNAKVECLETGVQLAQTTLGGIHTTKSLQDANGRDNGYLADLVYEAIKDAKAKVCQHSAIAA